MFSFSFFSFTNYKYRQLFKHNGYRAKQRNIRCLWFLASQGDQPLEPLKRNNGRFGMHTMPIVVLLTTLLSPCFT